MSDHDREIRLAMTDPNISRRTFALTTLSVGFALAVMPVSAETIVTDKNGLIAGEIAIPVSDGTIPGYRAMPATGGRHALVLVVHEIFGVHEHIKDLCRRLAKAGYFAVAPELFARQGDMSKFSSVQEILPVVGKVPDAQVMGDLDATVDWASKSDHADIKKFAIAGFCWGGRIVWLYSAYSPKVKAGAAWYGPLVGQPTDLKPKNPVDIAMDLKAPVLGLYGGKDQNIKLEHVEQMRAALKAANKKSEVIVYPDAEHGFNADYRPSYNAADAKAAWDQMIAWFTKNGVA
jgi:carboxymethylenebutenolidase